jgi:hypothetical protein
MASTNSIASCITSTMMEMPEQPESPKDPNFVGRPRNAIHSLATDKDDITVDPRWGPIGCQTIDLRHRKCCG